MTPIARSPRATQTVSSVVFLLGIVLAFVGYLSLDVVPPSAHAVAVWVLPALLIFSHLAPRRMVTIGGAVESFALDEILFVPLLLTLTPGESMLAAGVASIAGSIAVRRARIKAVFNCGQFLLAVTAGTAVTRLIVGQDPDFLSARDLAGAIAGTVTISLITHLAVSLMIAFASEAPVRNTVTIPMPHIVAWFGAAVLGASASILVFFASWGFVPAIALVGFVQRAYTSQIRESVARTQAEGLQRATTRLRATYDRAAIGTALTEAASVTLGAGRAVVVSHEKEAPIGSLTVTMPSGNTLAAVGRLGPGHWTNQEREILATLAGVADDAIRSADLIEQLRTITDSQTESVLAFDGEGFITFANPAARAILNQSTDDELIGRPTDDVFTLQGDEAPLDLMQMRQDETIIEDADAVLVARGSRGVSVAFSFSPTSTGQDSNGAIIVMRDVTERRGAQEALTYRALHDELTGLPNRRMFLDRLDEAMERSITSGSRHGVLCVDLDRFKIVNDSFGHIVGDQLLVQVTDRLQRTLGPDDALARLAGDEFMLLVEDHADHVVLPRLADRILSSLQQPYLVDGRTLFVTVSIGLALTHPGQTRDEVMAAVDAATYAAKGAGRNCVRIATQELVEHARSRSAMEARLRQAIDNGDLSLKFQPIIDTRTHELAGLEALARWEHPGGLSTSPAEFIPLAEDTGLIVVLGRWVLEESCRLTHMWNTRHPERDPIKISVNLSALQLAQPRVALEVSDVLERTGLAPAQLSLEITETAIFTDTDANVQAIQDLRDIGVGCSVDDFGTGYSSLAYLRKLPVDTVKLDASFIAGLGLNMVDTQIVASVLRLCKALGRSIIAEGVETELQWQTLARMGCPMIQGFLMARPLTVEQFERYWDAQYGPALRIVDGGVSG